MLVTRAKYGDEHINWKKRTEACVKNSDGTFINNEEFFWEHRFTIASFHEVLLKECPLSSTQEYMVEHSEYRC